MKAIFVILVAAMLMFGCIGEKPVTTATDTSDEKTGLGAGNTSGADTSDEKTGLGAGNSGSIDLIGKGFSDLVTLGIPVKCTIKYKDTATGATFGDMKIYIKGNKFKEVIEIVQGGIDNSMTIIDKGDDYSYIQYKNPQMLNMITQGKMQCDGLRIAKNVSSKESTITASVPNPSDLKDVNKVQLDCTPETFGDEMFAVTGNYCDFDEIIKKIYTQ